VTLIEAETLNAPFGNLFGHFWLRVVQAGAICFRGRAVKDEARQSRQRARHQPNCLENQTKKLVAMKKNILLTIAAFCMMGITAQAALCHRAEVMKVTATDGNWSPGCNGCIGGSWILFYNLQWVKLSSYGGGYYWRACEINGSGTAQACSRTGVTGSNIQVAHSGNPYTCPSCKNCGASAFSPHVAFWLNGSVWWQNFEGGSGCDMNWGFQPTSWSDTKNNVGNIYTPLVIDDNC
jgi:hypothetical protein